MSFKSHQDGDGGTAVNEGNINFGGQGAYPLHPRASGAELSDIGDDLNSVNGLPHRAGASSCTRRR
jgi:hypothetical protein